MSIKRFSTSRAQQAAPSSCVSCKTYLETVVMWCLVETMIEHNRDCCMWNIWYVLYCKAHTGLYVLSCRGLKGLEQTSHGTCPSPIYAVKIQAGNLCVRLMTSLDNQEIENRNEKKNESQQFYIVESRISYYYFSLCNKLQWAHYRYLAPVRKSKVIAAHLTS